MDNPMLSKRRRSKAWWLVIGCGLALLLPLAGEVRADEVVSSSVNLQPAPKKLSAEEWRTVSLAASRILKHVDQASTALAEKKKDIALANIAKGLTLTQIIDKIVPDSTVKTEIKAGGFTYQDEDHVKPTFVPIYREYDMVDIISPVTVQQQKKASSSAGKTASPKSVEVPDVTYSGFDYSGIKLNVRLAKNDLLRAQDLIKQGDTKGATGELQQIQQDGVIFEFSSIDLPLARAMDNLRLAESELKNNRPAAAKEALTQASDALKLYEKQVGESRSKEVQQLQTAIDEWAKNITQHNQETFSKEISEWWSKALNWFSK